MIFFLDITVPLFIYSHCPKTRPYQDTFQIEQEEARREESLSGNGSEKKEEEGLS